MRQTHGELKVFAWDKSQLDRQDNRHFSTCNDGFSFLIQVAKDTTSITFVWSCNVALQVISLLFDV